MEKTDILFVALSIAVIIFTIYICYIKARIKFIIDILEQHDEIIHKEAEIAKMTKDFILFQNESNNKQDEINKAQIKINSNQNKVNDNIIALLNKLSNSPSSTGGRRSEAEA